MSNRLRRQFTGRQKTEILKRHLLDRVAVSDFCDEYKIQPAQFYAIRKSSFLRRVKKPLSAALIPSKLQPLYRNNASPNSKPCLFKRTKSLPNFVRSMSS